MKINSIIQNLIRRLPPLKRREAKLETSSFTNSTAVSIVVDAIKRRIDLEV